MKYSIDEIMDMLVWNQPEEVQAKGRELAREVRCINVFFQPPYPAHGKCVWENCALILAERTDEELKPYISKMFEWLMDINWPGASCIEDRLKRFADKEWLNWHLEGCVKLAKATNDRLWLYSLMEFYNEEERPTGGISYTALSDAEVYRKLWRESQEDSYTSYIRGLRCKTVEDYFREISASFQFPKYFGENWPALDECLCDLEWLKMKRVFVIVDDFSQMFSEEAEEDRETIRNLVVKYFTLAVEEWKRSGVSFEAWLNN